MFTWVEHELIITSRNGCIKDIWLHFNCGIRFYHMDTCKLDRHTKAQTYISRNKSCQYLSFSSKEYTRSVYWLRGFSSSFNSMLWWDYHVPGWPIYLSGTSCQNNRFDGHKKFILKIWLLDMLAYRSEFDTKIVRRLVFLKCFLFHRTCTRIQSLILQFWKKK